GSRLTGCSIQTRLTGISGSSGVSSSSRRSERSWSSSSRDSIGSRKAGDTGESGTAWLSNVSWLTGWSGRAEDGIVSAMGTGKTTSSHSSGDARRTRESGESSRASYTFCLRETSTSLARGHVVRSILT
ncbi:hypothetical protein PENTCL1PPCAC_19367, partial [Pristionchus entomophagus]